MVKRQTIVTRIEREFWNLKPTLRIRIRFPELDGIEQTVTWLECKAFLKDMPHMVKFGILTPENMPNKLGGNELDFLLELGHDGVNIVEMERKNREYKEKDVFIQIEGRLQYIASNSETPSDRATYWHQRKDINFTAYQEGRIGQPIKIAESDWLRWLEEWGKEVFSVVVMGEIAAELKKIYEKLNVSSNDEFVKRLKGCLVELDHYRANVAINQSLIWTLPQDKTLKNKVEEVLSRIASEKGSALISGWVDGAIEVRLQEILRKGGEVRILVRPERPDKGVRDTLERLKRSGAEIKKNAMIHARVLIGNKECIVGSADLKTDSLDQNRETAVYTTDPVVIEKAKAFFEEVWEE